MKLGDILGNLLKTGKKKHVSLPNFQGTSQAKEKIAPNNAEKEI